MKKQLLVIGIIALLVCVGLSGCNEKDTNNGESFESSRTDIIAIWNNCSGDLEGSLTFELYEDSSMNNSTYNITYNISIKEGKTENFVITVPESIDNTYSYLYYSVTCNGNSTFYQRNGPWVNSELYEIYETSQGIRWKWVSFDM
jgi:major membrane immunogen (membrane-anchored lipoprotein)